MRTLSGKRALITGAASGIGRALALQLARAGCHTCLLDLDRAGVDETARQVESLKVEAFGLVGDVGQKDDLADALSRMLSRWPEIDILVNCAGVTFRGRSAEMTHADWERVLAVNLHGPIQICQRLLPVLLARPESHILNICSLLGLRGFSKFAAYSASKFGLVGYSEALRSEFIGSRLGVSALCPGFVRTPFIKSVPGPNGVRLKRSAPRWLSTTPEVVARKGMAAIRRNRGLALVTPFAHLTWWVKRFAPFVLELNRFWKTHPIAPPPSASRSYARQSVAAPQNNI